MRAAGCYTELVKNFPHYAMSTDSEKPFKIAIPEEKLDLLKHKLADVTFPDELEDAGWEYGVPLADMKRLIARWRDGYDWRVAEIDLNNALPQFTRDIEVEDHGVGIAKEDVKKILEHPTWNGIVMVDEAYIDFSPEGASLAELVAEWPNLVVMQTLGLRECRTAFVPAAS